MYLLKFNVMKYIGVLIIVLLQVLVSNAQSFQGSWYGQIVVGAPLKIVLHIEANGNKWITKMDSPDQKTFGIVMETTSIDQNEITIADKRMHLKITGRISGDTIVAQFQQGGIQLPIVFYNDENLISKPVVKRPQMPQPPFNYSIDTLDIKDAKGQNIHGVFTYPKDKSSFPVVVLISGSGTQDMDVTIFGHKLFWVIADYLTQNGIGVFRFDDKGTGQSEGNPATTTTDVIADDIGYVLKALQQNYSSQINAMYLLGHSQGGTVAMKYAAQHPKDLNGIVLMAAPGIEGKEIILQQYRTLGKMSGLSDVEINTIVVRNGAFYDAVIKGKDSVGIANALKKSIMQIYPTLAEGEKSEMTLDVYFQTINGQMNTIMIKDLIAYDPASDLSKIKCKVLAINGDLDIQVAAQPNLEAIKQGLQLSKSDVQIKTYPYLNHLFQYAITGSIEEYETIEETIDTSVLEDLATYLKQ